MATSREGAVWVKHGFVGPVDLLDGYFAPHFPDAHKSGALVTSPGGAVWMWGGGEILRLLDGSWMSWRVQAAADFGPERGDSHETWTTVSRTSPFLRGTVSIAAIDNDRALILLPDRVLEFDARHASTSPVLALSQCGLKRFVAMRVGLDGGVIVAGYGGWGRLTPDQTGAWTWKALPQPPSRFVEFDYPLEIAGQELFLTGVTSSSTAVALSFNGRRWTEWYQGKGRVVRGWPGDGGAVWVEDGNHLFEAKNGMLRPIEKKGVLSGIILSIDPESAGRFWVSTSQGLARSTPAIWSAPPGSPQLDDVVNSITEDRSGNVWFLEAHSLIRFDNSRWTAWPLPKDETPWAIFTDGLQSLPDGRLVVRLAGPHLLLFDPVAGKFQTIHHPGKRIVRMITSSPDGRVLVEALGPTPNDFAIEAFDGKTFSEVAGADKVGRGGDLRSVQIEANGGIFAGSTVSFTEWRNGVLHQIKAADGFTDAGAYYVYPSPDGRLFAGGRDGFFERRGSQWHRIQAGLDRVRKVITARDGTVWVASGNGLHRYRNGNWLSNTEEEGLSSSVVYNVFEDSRGRIWAGTTRGISLFNPNADPDPPLAKFDEDQNPKEAPPDGKVRLVFSGVDKWKFTPSSRLLFSWRMDGGEWSGFSPKDSQSFDHVRSGAHRFELRAMDRNGNISLAPAVHSFSVLVPWYASSGFILIAVFGLLLIVFFFSVAVMSYQHRGRLIQVLNTKHKLEQDRQRILQMIAGRDPLSLILSEIAGAVAENCAGSTCLLAGVHDGIRETYCYPRIPGKLWMLITDQDTLPRDLSQWRDRIRTATSEEFGPDLLVTPVSTGGEVSFVIALLAKQECAIAESAAWVLETFAGIAAAAIENNRLYRQLAHQANHDTLTDLPNRARFDEDLASMVKTGATGGHFAVLYLDLDRFKQINDSLGHRIGDLFLKYVASRLSGALNSAGKLFRIGGDEFIVLADAEGGREAIERLAVVLISSLSDPAVIAGNELFASTSIGISFFPEDGDTPSVLQKNADIAMYRAKSKGRNGFEFFVPEMTNETGASHGIEQILRHADREGRFRLCYQPRFTPAGHPAGFEARLRLLHPNRGVIEPAEFVPVAEESGLIVPIGQWVLREVCRQLVEWRSETLRETCISVNVSLQELSRPSYAAEVESLLAEMKLPTRMLQIELAETTLVANPDECIRQMRRLRALGIKLTIDDFGAGHSSIANLQTVPANALKIGRSFLRGDPSSNHTGSNHIVDTGPRLPMMQAVVALGRSLGLSLIAGDIETLEELSVVKNLLDENCDLVQGPLLGQPVLAAAARAFLEPLIPFSYFAGTGAQTDSSLSIASEHCAPLTS